jgi:hypothetical protein
MATSWNNNMLDDTNKALALLRQDIQLTAENLDASSVGKKCKLLVPAIIDEYKSMHRDSKDSGEGDVEMARVYHIASELAIPITGRAEDHKAFAELAEKKFIESKIRWYNEKLNSCKDEVLITLLQNFKSNDPAFASAWDIYVTRSSEVKKIAEKEVMNAHNWSFTNIEDKGAELAKTAYIELCVAKLAIPCGVDANIANLYLQKYADTLEKAKAKDLLVQAREIKDDDINHILSLIRQVYDAGDKAKPLDIRELTDRIDTFKEPSRKEVLSSYGWSFMRKEKRNPPCSSLPDGRFMSTVPGDAMKILGCFDCTGEKIEYTINGNRIIADRPPCRILYTTDPGEDMEEYPPLVRDAILLKIAESVATGLLAGATATPINASKARGLKNDYLQAVQTARTNDVKQINVGESAWGRNYLVDIMIGKRRGKWNARLW